MPCFWFHNPPCNAFKSTSTLESLFSNL
jgi:hypothetical protein